jgi:exopolysaccharide production protein ExoQ
VQSTHAPLRPSRLATRQLQLAAHSLVVVLTLLFVIVGRLPSSSRAGATDGSEGDPIMQLFYRTSYLAAALALAWSWRQGIGAVRAHPWTLILVLVALGSYHWSSAPDETIRRGVSLLGSTFLGLYLATRFDVTDGVRLLAWSLGLAALASLASGLLWPSVGLAEGRHAGAWRGIFAHKNMLGRAMVLGVVVYLYLFLAGSRRRWLLFSAAALCGIMVALSTSKTAALIGAVMLLLATLYNASRKSGIAAWTVAATAMVLGGTGALLLASNPDEALSAFGRDATLTGRTGLWEAVWLEILDRPVLGSGYGAFWSDAGERGGHIFALVGWEPPHSHNGFLDLALDLGVVGILPLAISFGVLLARSAVLLRAQRAAMWSLMFATFLVLYNLSESSLLRPGTPFWILYVATAVWVSTNSRNRPVGPRERYAGLSPGVKWRMQRRPRFTPPTAGRSNQDIDFREA